MPVSFEAIDSEWFAYHKNDLGSSKSNTAKLEQSPTRRGVTPRVVVEARDVEESDGRKGSPQARRRSQSVVRGQQYQSRSRSRTLSPKRREVPMEAGALLAEDVNNSGKKIEKNKTTRESNPGARDPSPVFGKSKNGDLSFDNSAKTTHHCNTEERSSPASQNNMYTTARRSFSSLTSTASTRREEAHAVAVLQKLQQQPKSQPATSFLDMNRKDFKRFQEKALMKKQQQSALRKAGLVSGRTDISLTEGYLATPISISESSLTASPNIIYQALRTGNSSTLSQTLASPLNLNDVLRGSTSDVSGFHDFHNPNVQYDPPLLLPTPPSSLSKGRRSSNAEDADSVSTATSSVLKQRMVLRGESRSLDSSEEMTYYRYVSRHSILQLCTEDLMSDNWKLVDYALYRLCEVCCTVAADSENDHKTAAANRIRFVKAGGHALIVGVMKKFSGVADLQTSACRLIQNFVSLDREGAFNELFASVYGMDRVLVAIQKFPPTENEDGDVYRYACGALVAIVCSSFKMVQRLMQDPRNLRVFLKAMHSDVNQNVVGVCRVLNFISKQPDYHDEIVSAGGLEEISGEMKQNPENLEVQYCGCEALGSMVKSSKSADVAELAVNELASAHLAVAAMKAFPASPDLQEKATCALFHFSAYPSVQASIKKAAGLSALGLALENFPNNKTIQEHGCAAMKRLLEAARSTSE